jgi:probable HAF family extracellular repeat protein
MRGQQLRRPISVAVGAFLVLGGWKASGRQAESETGDAANGGTFTTFDAPGASTETDQGTFALSMNPSGSITGYYIINANHGTGARGFVRSIDGTITTFDAPGSTNTRAHAINAGGVITGDYYDSNGDHGFLRASDGTFTTFDVPGASSYASAGAINPAGVVTGTYYDTSNVAHGFVRASDGTTTTIDAPGAEHTEAFGITPEGVVTGCYEENGAGYLFTQTSDGTFTSLDLPNSGVAGPWGECTFDYFYFLSGGIPLVGINPSGDITSAYFQTISGDFWGGNYRGFLRSKNGNLTFDAVPSPTSPCCTWTYGIAINPQDVIAGFYNDYYGINHGFVRAVDGLITTLDAPGASTSINQGTWAFAINAAGQVMGQYDDENYVFHGFLWTPAPAN